jgi:hypothetical protein
MSVKLKLFGVPATILGVGLGLLIGGLAAANEVIKQRFPKLGLVIIVTTPVLSFLFEQVASRAFPEQYRDRFAAKLIKLYRYILNDDFRLRFVYKMRFPVAPESPKDITQERICMHTHLAIWVLLAAAS